MRSEALGTRGSKTLDHEISYAQRTSTEKWPTTHYQKTCFSNEIFLLNSNIHRRPNFHCCSLLTSHRNRGLIRHNLFPLWMRALKSAKWQAALYCSVGDSHSLSRDHERLCYTDLTLFLFSEFFLYFIVHVPFGNTLAEHPCQLTKYVRPLIHLNIEKYAIFCVVPSTAITLPSSNRTNKAEVINSLKKAKNCDFSLIVKRFAETK